MTRRLPSLPAVFSLLLAPVHPLVLCGCGGIGTDGYRPFGAHSEQRVSTLRQIRLREGQTCSDEVVRVLGEPDYRNDDGSLIAYHWEVAMRHRTKQGRLSRNRLDADPVRYLLVMKFDEAGLLSRHRRRRVPVWRAASWVFEEVAKRWGVSPGPPSTQPKPPEG